jgi:hypothetical protein
MHHGVDAMLFKERMEASSIGKVNFAEDSRRRDSSSVPFLQIVESDDMYSTINQYLCTSASDVARGSGNQYVHLNQPLRDAKVKLGD